MAESTIQHRLSAQNLEKSFKARTVVKGVSIELQSGEIVGLLGPNGAGKTTSFYMIVGLLACDKGKILFDDENITSYPMHKRARKGIGYLPQEASVFRKLSVADNIMGVLQLRDDMDRAAREKKLEQTLEEFNITHLRDNIGMSLSGGERRRVEIARAVAMEPDFILLDEPFAGVDPISIIDIKNIIRHLSERNIGVLITDHNVRETLAICERAYIVSDGEVICTGSAEDILGDERVRQVYLGEGFSLG